MREKKEVAIKFQVNIPRGSLREIKVASEVSTYEYDGAEGKRHQRSSLSHSLVGLGIGDLVLFQRDESIHLELVR